jgi:anti-sigma regulatory factor (Ser/Thr protein kinase)/anti-anti-sigma regulatory factor
MKHKEQDNKRGRDSLQITLQGSEECAEVAILGFEGELDTSSIAKIGRGFDPVIEGNYVFVIIDLSRVRTISSAAIGELMGCRTHMLERGGEVVFAGLSLSNREKLAAMDANRIFMFYSDIRSAINAYNWQYRGKSEEISLTFPSVLRFVPPVRQLVSRIARQRGYGSRDSFRIETIVDEVCNNAVEHGIADHQRPIELRFRIDRRKVEINIVNVSDPSKVPLLKEMSKSLYVPHISDDDKRGRGLALVKMLSSDFTIDTSDDGTSVHVTKLREE